MSEDTRKSLTGWLQVAVLLLTLVLGIIHLDQRITRLEQQLVDNDAVQKEILMRLHDLELRPR